MSDTFGIQIINNATINITLSTFSLYDALTPNSQYSTMPPQANDLSYVFITACGPDPDEQNCTASCLDAGTVFGSLDTLRNCMAYPTIAEAYLNDRLSPKDIATAEQLAIQKTGVNDTLSENIIDTVKNCLQDYCSSLTGCMDAMNEDLRDDPSVAILNSTSTFYFGSNGSGSYYDYTSFDLCSFLPESALSVNQDIGGIGVYVSYWIQIGIALLGFLGIFVMGPGIHYLTLLLTPRYGHAEAKRRALGNGSRTRKLHLPALATALTDFQKAQCFFMLAINIAALIDKVNGGLQPQSLQQLYNSYILIKSVSVSGYLPITFNLFTLHLVDMVSWYLLVLSAFTIAVSITTLFAVGNFDPSKGDIDYLSEQAGSGGPQSCGGKVPGAWCYTPLNYYDYYDENTSDPSNGAYQMLGFCLVVFLLLVAYHLRFHRYFPKLSSNRSSFMRWSRESWAGSIKLWRVYLSFQDRIFKHQQSRRSRRPFLEKVEGLKRMQWRRWPIISWTQSETSLQFLRQKNRKIRIQWILTKEAASRSSEHLKAVVTEIGYPTLGMATVVLCLYIVFFGVYVNFFMIFCNDLAWFASNGVDKNSWSFGQIVAITVWAAPICEWLHLELRGMKRGFEHRLLPPYRVVSHVSDVESGVVTATPLLSPEGYTHDPKGAYEKLTAESPTSPEEHRQSLQKGGYAKVETASSPRSQESEEEQEEDITWQLPEFRRSESIRLFGYE